MILRFLDRRKGAIGGGADTGQHAVRPGGAGFDSFGAAVLEQIPRLRRYAIALARDVTLADDLVQDCMERALKNRQALEDPAKMPGWLRSILHNLYMDTLREKQRRGPHLELDSSVDLAAASVAPIDRSETRDFVRAMNSLSAEHREILLLIGLEGRSYREIADELSIPIGTVMSRLARARNQLRLKLESPDPSASHTAIASFPARTASH